ncbi:hypothetical protein [Rhinolophus gammaherpesvirus 1]|uniref:Tegument protein G48 n=1 Tax=Rhinolophus gammaherpesvirus 1 TaxID=2054179 RepID=A0A2Z5U6C8_9GAMA|nr:hypothetical protein [Rhinolophus gammaherpesvirus 1]BBB06496.1 hypothetical protein [Rhinolophus gammaherpesvirus 1]
MASSRVQIPIPGVSSKNYKEWQSHMDNFVIHQRPTVALRNIQRMFGGDDHPGMLASLAILNSSFGGSEKFKHKLSVVEVVKHSEKTCKTIYRHLKDHKYETDVETIFIDCKERLCLVYENTCGCVDCLNLIKGLQRATAFMRPPKLHPHHKHSRAAMFLTWTYNQVVLNLNLVILEEEVAAMYISSSDFFDFEEEVKTELSLLTSCLNFCWLYFMVKRYVEMELNMIQEQMIKTCHALGIPPVTSLSQAKQVLEKIPLPTPRDQHHLYELERHLLGYDPLQQIHIELSKPYHLTPQSSSRISNLMGRKRLSPAQKANLFRKLGLMRSVSQTDEVSQKFGHMKLESNPGMETVKHEKRKQNVSTFSPSHPVSESLAIVVSEGQFVSGNDGTDPDDSGNLEEIELLLSDEEDIQLEISDEEDDDEDEDYEVQEDFEQFEELDDDKKLGVASGGIETEDYSSEEEDGAPFYDLDRFQDMLYEESSKDEDSDEPKTKKKPKSSFKDSGYFREDV